jgi:predicted nucleotidyltransferase
MNTEKITSHLKQIEVEKNIEILYACETGSRAWGFASPDSDYDIRFIYKHKKDWYLSINEKKDFINIMLDNGELDITGWDLKKSLLLLNKSNAALIERFTSPIVYFEKDNTGNNFRALINKSYNRVAVFYHHHSLAKKFWDELKVKVDIKLKSLFYLIRSLLSCNYVLNNTDIVPMNIFPLLDLVDKDFKEKMLKLIEVKKSVTEKYLHHLDKYMKDWIENMFTYVEANKSNLITSKNNIDNLNDFFLKTLNNDN